jgi:hypothetical protein
MYLEEKQCIPLSLQKLWLREQHSIAGHMGGEAFWKFIKNRAAWADSSLAKSFAFDASKMCDTCQACNRVRTWSAPIVPTPIPPQIMASVAIDLFRMPPTWVSKKLYDTMVVCVDRHSGWMVAVACRDKGLTGTKVAKK